MRLLQVSLVFVYCLIAIAWGTPAVASPWLREKGTGFSASSFSTTYYLETSTQTYLEYGLTGKTTLVAHIGMLRSYTNPRGGHATFSFRRALSKPDAPAKWAYELGIGAGWQGELAKPQLRTALSFGKGMKWRETSGWMTVEAAVIWDVSAQDHLGKVDATLGMNFTDVLTGMVQVYTAHASGKSAASIAPSLIVKPGWSPFQLQIGAESELGDPDNSALKIGLWRTF